MTVRRGLLTGALAITILAGISAAAEATAGSEGTPVCRSMVGTSVLPVWARGGLSDPKPRIPHVLGRSGRIVAVLFTSPLLSPPPRDHNNKILRVARKVDWPALRLRAHRLNRSARGGAPRARASHV